MCRASDSTTTAAFSAGSSTVGPGETVAITFTVSTSGSTRTKAGLNVSASGGSFTAGTATQVSSSQITHTSATAMSASTATFSFDWTAPTAAGTYTLNFGPGPPEGNLQFSDQRDIAISFPGADASGLAVRLAGGGSATYQASSTHMSTSGYADSGTASILGGPVTASSPFSNTGDGGVEYTCDDDLLIAQIDGTPVYANRTPTTPKGTPYFR